jgi:4-aminobutyrate aminotransferase/(S)-3-amino-2-methylpropionate transaminase
MDTAQQYDKYIITSMLAGIEPVVVASAAGCVLKAADGKEYLDCFAGIAVNNAGHCHPKVIAAAKAQMDRLVHCCTYVYYCPPAAQLAERLAAVTPGRLQKTFFGNSGAEANEGAMRLCRQFTKHWEYLALTASFHGRTNATLSVTGNAARKKGGGPYLTGVAFAPAPYCYRCPLHCTYPSCGVACAQAIEDTIKLHTSDRVACFIVEPVMGEGGIITPPPEYFQIAEKIVHAHGALMLIDEVQSGFGRTGKLFAIEHYGIEPDVMTMAKGIADGFPLSGFIAREDVAGAFTPGDHLSTFGGNPVSCAAGLANLQVMLEEKLPENSAARGARIMARLKKFADKQPLVGDVRGKGLMIGIELVTDRKSKTPAADQAKAVRAACREHGVLVGRGGLFANVIRIQPPLVITEAQAEHACDVLEAAINQAAKG